MAKLNIALLKFLLQSY